MVQELCRGSCVALEVKGETEEKTFTHFRCLVGPMDPVIGFYYEFFRLTVHVFY